MTKTLVIPHYLYRLIKEAQIGQVVQGTAHMHGKSGADYEVFFGCATPIRCKVSPLNGGGKNGSGRRRSIPLTFEKK